MAYRIRWGLLVGSSLLGTSCDAFCPHPTSQARRVTFQRAAPDDDAVELLQETRKRMEEQQKQIDKLTTLLQKQNGEDSYESDTPLVPLKAMLFIDGTWLYYSLSERHEADLIEKFGPRWQFTNEIDWSVLPKLVCRALTQSWTSSRPVEVVRVLVFSSYKADTPRASFRYQMFEQMKAANFDVHLMETVGKGEKCVDIQLAVEMLHYATVPNAYDVAILLTGDKDFMPAMIRTRQKGRKVGLMSMKKGCNRALDQTPGLRDYDVIWLEDYLDEFIVPKKTSGATESLMVSPFTLMKVMYDFIKASGMPRVSSRDIGRYLKSQHIGNSNLLEEMKLHGGGLKQFLAFSDIFEVENREASEPRDYGDRSYYVKLRANAAAKLAREAQSTQFSKEEKRYLQSHSSVKPEDQRALFYHTRLAEGVATGADTLIHDSDVQKTMAKSSRSPVELPHDLAEYKVTDLKEVCRKLGLPVSGTKQTLVDRIQDHVEATNLSHTDGEAIDPDVLEYLDGLVAEYLHASGGRASSRDIGRYLAASRSSDGTSRSALNETKSVCGSLKSYLSIRQQKFQVEEDEGSYEFFAILNKGVTVPTDTS